MTTRSMERESSSVKMKLSEKGVFFSFETLGEIESALEEILSQSAASTILRTASTKAGATSCKEISNQIGTRENVLDTLIKLKESENWGILTFHKVDFEKGTGTITVVDSFESKARTTTNPCCHIFRGFLEGFLSEFFGKAVEVTEEKCAGKGDKKCRFTFK